MNQPPDEIITATLKQIELDSTHPTRRLARRLIGEYRRGSAIDPNYEFLDAPEELRQIVYDGTVRYSAYYSWLSRLFR